MIFARSGRSILSQTFWLLVGSAIVVEVVLTFSLFFFSSPRQEGVPLVQIVERLRGKDTMIGAPYIDLPVHLSTTPPHHDGDLAENADLTNELAGRLAVSPDDVRIFFRPRSRTLFSFRDGPADGITRWRGEPIFFDRAIVAARKGNQWRTIQTPDRPLIAEWQKRMALNFGLSLLALLPLALLFARRLVRPIRAFADAADRVGRDTSAPMVPEVGPRELRVAARAVNAMQGRIAEQMREREAMVAAIAHDLRTPLSRIAFRIEAADDKLRDPIQRDVDQMKAMITTTLSYVQGSSQNGRQEPVDIKALLDDIIANEQHVDRPVSWQAVPHNKERIVRGDRIALGRLIQNLVDNAIAYGSQAQLSLDDNGDGQIVIIIADKGPGLPAEDVEAMFAPFARQDRSRNRETGGVGLGLAIARAIARDHGGEVKLQPRAGGGMEARITLPLAPSAN